MRKSLTEKELGFISKLELKKKYFFTRNDIKDNFNNANEMNVYIHRLRKKGRIIKLNKTKYFLIPVKAVEQHWSEHPFILIDEMMNGKDYCIGGKSAVNYWKMMDQIPVQFDIYNTKRQGITTIFYARLKFKRRLKKDLPKGVIKKVYGHKFIIATKKESKKWI